MLNKRLIIFLAFLLGAFTAAGVILYLHASVVKTVAFEAGVPISEPEPEPEPPEYIAAGIVPHHLVAREMIEEFFTEIAASEPETIVLVSPDHWGRAQDAFSITGETEYFEAPIDTRLQNVLRHGDSSNYFGVNEELMEGEHGLAGLVPFIVKLMPETQIVPIAIAANASSETVDKVVSQLFLSEMGRTTVISSTDFSHYLPSAAADMHDTASIAVLENLQFDKISDLELDCWQCLYFATSFADKHESRNAEMLNHTNSAKIVDSVDKANEVTSYVSMVYREGELVEKYRPVSMLFVGDMMFGRYVETLMRTHGNDYPFENIFRFLKGVDILHGNHEGPVVYSHYQTPNNSTSFSFSEDKAATLKTYGFDVVTLANNHTLDRGQQGWLDSQEILSKYGIGNHGHTYEVGDEYIYETQIGDQEFEFLSYNTTFPWIDKAAAVEQVRRRATESEAMIIVSVHWGAEYKSVSNSYQQTFAHDLIDAGADVIIAHHPHVTQEIEEYNGKLIFYSLGNFIFDQYFSVNTQESYALGMEVGEDQIVYRIFPLQSRMSQPQLMSQEKSQTWLETLAARSSESLREDIKQGIITVVK
ncbi:MAG: AmmeMemoRadiSam system protein B [Patescibacteria group bacterium]